MSVEVRQDDTRPKLPRPDARLALLASVAVVLLIMLGEIDQLLSQVVDPDAQRVWSVNALSGPFGWFDRESTAEGWRFVADPGNVADPEAHPLSQDLVDSVGAWLTAYAMLDVGLALVYGWLGVLWFSGRSARGGLLILTAATADILENLQILVWTPHPYVLMACTLAKWLALLGAAYYVWSEAKDSITRLPRALYTHRYSALIVLPLAFLSLGRGPDLLEQVPDIQRAWGQWNGVGDLVAAGGAMSILGLAAFVIGRQRTGHLWTRTCPLWTAPQHTCTDKTCPVILRRAEPQPDPLLRLWLLGPALLALSAVGLRLLHAPVNWGPLLVFCAIPVGIGWRSWRLRGKPADERPKRVHRDPISVAQFRTSALVGDLLVGLLPVVAGLGIFRAFVGPTALLGARPGSLCLLFLGGVSIALAWPALVRAQRALDRWADGLPADFVATTFRERFLVQLTPGISMERGAPPKDDPTKSWQERAKLFLEGFKSQRSAWTVFALSGAAMVGIALVPVFLARWFGVIATFQLALGTLSVLIAATVILLQPGGSPEFFWRFKVPFAPVTSLVVAACIFAALAGGGDVHRIRPYAGPAADLDADDRPALGSVFADWLRNGRSCAEEIPDTEGLKIRPLLLYAAEGGGIRAAYWTTSAIDLISTAESSTGKNVKPICRSAFLSSGASGGSVGLSIASVRDPGTAAAAVKAMAGPEALGAASDGLVLRDTIYAATGVPLPSLLDRRTRDVEWSDRGTLIEHAWEQAVPSFDTPWIKDRPSWRWSWGPAGALVVNSTSPTTRCRTLISQIRLENEGGTGCSPQPTAASTDLVACTNQLRTSTAALLTARFPYVTPSGVVSCTPPSEVDQPPPDDVELQVVDGGYAENTGVGTLVDLMPRLMAEVRSHNDCVLAEPRPAACTTEPTPNVLVVPQLVYFDNGTGSDLVARPSGLKLEALVPPLTILGAKGALYSARAQLERAYALLGTDQLWSGRPSKASLAKDAVEALRANQVAVVLQKTRPTIAAPLGWMLSDVSIEAMDKALCDQQAVTNLDFSGTRALDPAQAVPAEEAVLAEPAAEEFGTITDVLATIKSTSSACLD